MRRDAVAPCSASPAAMNVVSERKSLVGAYSNRTSRSGGKARVCVAFADAASRPISAAFFSAPDSGMIRAPPLHKVQKMPATELSNEIADRYIQLLGIVTPSPEQLVKNLSGGNQQKVILARWLATDPKVLILDEPTRGIDVGAKTEIQKLVMQLAEEGKSCVFISSELEEVVRVSDRVAVLRDRKKVAEYGGDVDEKTLIQAMAGEA